MIISKTPFRISFFGGGTDYPAWYRKYGGAVLATTIDKYCYITCRYLPPFFEHKIRVVYSKVDSCKSIDEISHPSVRETLRFLKMNRGVEIHHDGDLPARSGMGSSSAFTVGLLHALYALKGRMPSKHQLARESIHIEQEILKETVGSQDQMSAAYGGLNLIEFSETGEISIKPVTLTQERIKELNSHLMLFYTGIIRTAADIAESYVNGIEERKEQLSRLNGLLEGSIEILNADKDIAGFGRLLHEAWNIKRSLSARVSNPKVDEIYSEARSAGAVGGKLTGAGGGGFMLLFVPPEKQREVRRKLNNLIYVPFKFEFSGSQIVFLNHQEDYSILEKEREKQTIQMFKELEDIKT